MWKDQHNTTPQCTWDVQFVGERTKEERNAELREAAINVDNEDQTQVGRSHGEQREPHLGRHSCVRAARAADGLAICRLYLSYISATSRLTCVHLGYISCMPRLTATPYVNLRAR